VAVDCHGGSQLFTIIFELLNGIASNEYQRLTNAFTNLNALINETIEIFEQMYEYNFPNVFYKRVRPYLAGWTNDKALPDGLHYGEGSPGEFYAGASVSQGAFFQALDIALGIEHPLKGHHEEATGTKVGLPGVYLKDMRNYMPRSHRDFLNWLEGQLDVAHYMNDVGRHHPELKEAYNHALKAMEAFRTSHVKMVSLYIITQAHKEDHTEVQGTGGSNPIPFLKAIRSHVQDAELP
jgi:indoleamine 2,3-dioxygenase